MEYASLVVVVVILGWLAILSKIMHDLLIVQLNIAQFVKMFCIDFDYHMSELRELLKDSDCGCPPRGGGLDDFDSCEPAE